MTPRCAMLATAVAAAAAVVLTGCTGSSGSTNSGTPTSTSSGGASSSSAPQKTPSPTGTQPSIAIPSRPTVPLHKIAHVTRSVIVRIDSVRAIQGKPVLPGEVKGPAVAVRITVRNNGTKAVVLDPVVNAYYGPARTPALTLSGAPAKRLPTVVGPHAVVTGIYPFTMSMRERRNITIEVIVGARLPVVRFHGSV